MNVHDYCEVYLKTTKVTVPNLFIFVHFQINSWLKNLSVRHAPIVSLIEGGRSYQGRTIYGVRVSYSPNNFNNSVFLESSIHANEWYEIFKTNTISNQSTTTISNIENSRRVSVYKYIEF